MDLSDRHARCLNERKLIIKTICARRHGSRSRRDFSTAVVNAGQERPFVSQAFGPQPTFISDHTQEIAGFLQSDADASREFDLCCGGRFDHFNQFGDVWTYRVAGSYHIDKTNTTLHSSVATGFSPPSSQDKIFGNNSNLDPEKDFGWDIGIRQDFGKSALRSI